MAEFVENSIDAQAENIAITRGKKKGEFYLKVADDGEGIPKNKQGLPDFQHVVTHICGSVKRRLKAEDAEGVQGEFGIGLRSFWTVRQNLSVISCRNRIDEIIKEERRHVVRLSNLAEKLKTT